MQIPYKQAVLLRKLVAANCGPVCRAGNEHRCRCPAHDDSSPSLYVRLADDRILIRCNAGCSITAICDHLDHAEADLFISTDEPLVEVNGEFDGFDHEPPAVPPPVNNRPLTSSSLPMTDNPTVASNPPAPAEGDTESTDVPAGQLRHDIYQQFLGQLELSTTHFDNLQRRGLSADEITRRGYRAIDSRLVRAATDQLVEAHGCEQLLTVPGFRLAGDRVIFTANEGMLIPARDLAGQIVALKVRHDAANGGPKYTWASNNTASCGNVVHAPLGITAPVATIRITEGELKSDVATVLSDVPTISAPGVGNWRLAIPVLRALGAHTVLVAFDQDGKSGTLRCMEEALLELTREGFEAQLEWWDGAVGKGVDDLLAAGGQPEIVAGLSALLRVQAARASSPTGTSDEGEMAVATFPVDVFPPDLAAFCREVGEATGTPPDFAGLTMLVTAGAAIGNSRALCVKDGTWYESGRMYGANIGPPASGKTPAVNLVLKPYEGQQQKLLTEYRNKKREFDEAEAELKRVTRENRAHDSGSPLSLPAVPEKPTRPDRFVAVDATVEALAPLLQQNPRGLLLHQDEGVGWVRGMDQYKGGRGNDRQFWMSVFSGSQHIGDRKIQHGEAVSVPRPFINVIIGLQPDMLSELNDARGRRDGFLDRILPVMPRASTGNEWSDATVSEEAATAWADMLTRLRGLKMANLDDGEPGYKVAAFSEAAKAAWVTWWDEHAAELRGPELAVQLIGPWGKLRTYAARLALILHCLWTAPPLQAEAAPAVSETTAGAQEPAVDIAEPPISAATVERAIQLINYFKSHIRAMYGRLRQTPAANNVFDVVDWIRRHGGECRVRDLLRGHKAENAESAKKMLHELEERGYGRIEARGASNGKTVNWFIFDPA